MFPVHMPPLVCRAVATLALTAVGFVTAGPAAGSCAVLETRGGVTAVQRAGIVFVGTVTSVRSHDRIATFDVEEIWKGPNLSDPIEVHGGPEDPNETTSVDRTWIEGTHYLVFPEADKAGLLHDNACSPTSVYTAADVALRPTTAHPPQGPPTSGLPGATPIAAIFLAILVLGSLGAFLLYRRGRGEPLS